MPEQTSLSGGGPRPPPKVLPNPQQSNQGRNELEYAGVAWVAQRVNALRKKVDEDKEIPLIDIKEYALDSVAADRQWGVARC